MGEIFFISGQYYIQPITVDFSFEYELFSPSGIRDIESTLTYSEDAISLVFMPDEPGDWTAAVRLIVEGVEDPIIKQVEFLVQHKQIKTKIIHIQLIL